MHFLKAIKYPLAIILIVILEGISVRLGTTIAKEICSSGLDMEVWRRIRLEIVQPELKKTQSSIMLSQFHKFVKVGRKLSLTVSDCTIGFSCSKLKKRGRIRLLRTLRIRSSKLWSLVQPTISSKKTSRKRVKKSSSGSKLLSASACKPSCQVWHLRIWVTARQLCNPLKAQPWNWSIHRWI